MGHLYAGLSQDWRLFEECIDDHVVIGDAKVENAASVVTPLVLWRLEDTVDGGFEVIAGPPKHDLAGVDDDGAGNILNVSTFELDSDSLLVFALRTYLHSELLS